MYIFFGGLTVKKNVVETQSEKDNILKAIKGLKNARDVMRRTSEDRPTLNV